jgi:glycosyltransferase involved in cell wall biosynthesis
LASRVLGLTPTNPISTATVVTPCLNAEALIERTAESVIRQSAVRSGRLQLQYLVCDGASTDRTLDIVRDVCGDRAEVVSQKDASMYEALAKGLQNATGDVVSYLNAGDVYASTALDVVADVFEQHRDVEWVTGLNVLYNEKGHVVSSRLPIRYRRRFASKGLYGSSLLPLFIQQESTFWRARLMSVVDLERLAEFRLAGDSYLWTCFAREADPVTVESYLGGWTHHRGQLSSDTEAYRRELRTLRVTPGLVDIAIALFDRAERLAPHKLRKWLNPRGLLRYSFMEERWR